MRYRQVTVAGFDWNLIDEGSGPAILLCHGFPGLAYSWRHQVEPLVTAGFRVIAPDMPGYGATTAPATIGEYTYTSVGRRLIGLLDALDVDRVVMVGHDFGAPTAWTLALTHPWRIAGLVLMAMPYSPDRLPIKPSDAFTAVAQNHFFHFEYFLQPGLADAELDAAPREFLHRIHHALSGAYRYLDIWQHPSGRGGTRVGYLDALPEAPPLPWAWLSATDVGIYESAYGEAGFTGGLNWYRAADLNWEQQAAQPRSLDVPAMFLCGGNDPVLTMAGAKAITRMREMMPRLQRVEIYEGAGHFIQMERAGEVSAALVEFAVDLDW